MNDARRMAAGSAATLAGIAAVLSGLALMQSSGVGDCGADCAAALASRWSTIPFGVRLNTEFGLPVALVGLMYFSGLAAWLFLVIGQPGASRAQSRATLTVGLIGACVSLGYLTVMITNGQLCPLCLATHVVNFAMLPFLWLAAPTETEPAASSHWPLVTAVAVMLAACEMALWFGWDAARLRGEQRELVAAVARASGGPATASTPMTFARDLTAQEQRALSNPEAIIAATEQPAATVEIYTDLLCLGCRFFERTFLEDYLPLFQGRVTVILRHFPLCAECNPDANNLHASACDAAYVVEAARRQGGSLAVLKVLHEIDPQHPRSFDQDDLNQLAKKCGLDAVLLAKDFRSTVVRERIREDIEKGRSLGVRQTPTVLLDGKPLAATVRDQAGFWQELAAKLGSQPAGTQVASTSPGTNAAARPTIASQEPAAPAQTQPAPESVVRTKPSDDEREAIAKEILETNDANRDGTLDRKEWSKAYKDGSLIDKDHDGFITLAEIKAGIKEIQSPANGAASGSAGNQPKPAADVPRTSSVFAGDTLNLQGETLDGGEFNLAKLKGQPVLVAYWATWCPYCIDESADLLRLYRTYHERGLEIVGISSDLDPGRLRHFVQQNEMSWPQLYSSDPDARGRRNPWAVKYNVLAYPALFLVGADGTVKEVHLRGRDLEVAVAKELAVEPVPETEAAEQTAEIKAKLPVSVLDYEAPLPLKIGDRIPVAGIKVDGTRYDSNSHRGKAIVVAFWASWCPHCRKELPVLADLYSRYKELGLEVVGISLDRSYNDLQKFLKDSPLPWTTLYSDIDGLRGFQDPLARWFNVRGIPTLYLFDQEGRVAAMNVRGPNLETEVAKLLGEAPAAAPVAETKTSEDQPKTTPGVAANEKPGTKTANAKTITEPKMARRVAEVMLKKFDQNQDGWLERQEWEKSSKSLSAFDVNKDGKLSLDELTAAILVSQKIKAQEDEQKEKSDAVDSAKSTTTSKAE